MFERGITRACVMPARSINALEFDVPMFSRGFVRRRVISLATSLSVMATSFALAQDPKHPPRTRTANDIDDQQFLSDSDLATSTTTGGAMMKPTGDIDSNLVDRMILCPTISSQWMTETSTAGRAAILASISIPAFSRNVAICSRTQSCRTTR